MLVFIALSGGGGGKGKEEERKKRKKRGKKPTTADLNVALIKMACTQGEEKYKPRNVFHCTRLLWLLSSLLLPLRFLFSLFVLTLFFFMSPISFPTPFLFLFSFYFLAEEAQCLCIKVTTGGCLQLAGEKNKVTAQK